MARNRKSSSTAIQMGTAFKVVLACLFFGGLGVGYVWQMNQVYTLGQQRKTAERRLEELRLQNKRWSDHWSGLRSAVALDERVKRLNLGLAPAQPGQIIRLPDPLVADQGRTGASNPGLAQTWGRP